MTDTAPANLATSVPSAPKPKMALWKRALRGLLVVLLGTYMAFCLMLYLAQDALIFPGTNIDVIREAAPPPRTQILKHEFAPGKSVEAWYIPTPDASKDHPAPLLVLFHGNYEFIDHNAYHIQLFNDMGWSVLIPEFRGYNRSAGSPNQSAFLEDNTYFLNQTLSRPEVDSKHVAFYARSLGGGPACDLARVHPPQALLLNCTFSSLVEMARPYRVPTLILKNTFYSDRVVQSFPGPIFIAHGDHDEVIPYPHALTLKSLAKNPTFLKLDCGHNDFPGSAHAAYWVAVKTFLDTVKLSSRN